MPGGYWQLLPKSYPLPLPQFVTQSAESKNLLNTTTLMPWDIYSNKNKLLQICENYVSILLLVFLEVAMDVP